MKKYRKENRLWLVVSLVCISTSNLFAVLLQFLKGNVLDSALQGNSRTALTSAAFLISFILAEVFFYFAYNYFSAKYVVKCTHSLKHDVFSGIFNRSYIAYKTRPAGEYVAKYVSEVDSIKGLHFSMIPALGDVFFKIILVSAALFRLDWRIALVTLALLTTPLYVPKLIEKNCSLHKATISKRLMIIFQK